MPIQCNIYRGQPGTHEQKDRKQEQLYLAHTNEWLVPRQCTPPTQPSASPPPPPPQLNHHCHDQHHLHHSHCRSEARKEAYSRLLCASTMEQQEDLQVPYSCQWQHCVCACARARVWDGEHAYVYVAVRPSAGKNEEERNGQKAGGREKGSGRTRAAGKVGKNEGGRERGREGGTR